MCNDSIKECVMKYILSILLFFVVTTAAMGADGAAVMYQVNGQTYEGYYISPSDKAPLVVLIHDWDGLTDYEVKRAHMLAASGYAVFAADLFGAGVRPTEVVDKRQTKKPDRGIVSFFQRVNNQDEEPVMEYTIRRMIRRKHV